MGQAPFRRVIALVVAGCILGLPAAGAAQQPGAALTLEVRAADGAVEPRLGPVLSGRGIRGSLEAGLPVRIRVVTELWRDRVFDAQEARHEWRASVWYDPLDDAYRVQINGEPAVLTASPDGANRLLASRLRVPLVPGRPGRYYYLARVEVETLSRSDLDELRRWLQGDLAPAVEGERGVGSAVGRGLQRLFIRILGLPAERYQARSPSFRHPDPGG